VSDPNWTPVGELFPGDARVALPNKEYPLLAAASARPGKTKAKANAVRMFLNEVIIWFSNSY
jgi:hypothetical protein